MDNKTVRNVILAALGLFILMPRKSSANTQNNNNTSSGNGYIPTTGSEGSLDESFLGITPTSSNRGVRNNNPGNIKYYSSNAWQGKVPVSQNTDAIDTDGEPKFEQFVSYPHGVRAMIYLLKNSYIVNGHNTLTKILDRYDPGFNINYLNFLSSYTGLTPTEVILATDELKIKKIVQGLTRFENGRTGANLPEIVTDLQYQTARNIL